MDYSQPAACLALLHEAAPDRFPATHATLTRIVERPARGLPGAQPAPRGARGRTRDAGLRAGRDGAHAYAIHPLQPSRRAGGRRARARRLAVEGDGALLRGASPTPTRAKARSRTSARCSRSAGSSTRASCWSSTTAPTSSCRKGCGGRCTSAYNDAVRNGLAQVRVTDPLNEVWRAQSAHEAYCRHPARRARQPLRPQRARAQLGRALGAALRALLHARHRHRGTQAEQLRHRHRRRQRPAPARAARAHA
jgi:hypothetical protein